MKRLSLCLLFLFPYVAIGQVSVAAFFSSNMVLQRDEPIAVWGKANPGNEVTVKFYGESKKMIAAAIKGALSDRARNGRSGGRRDGPERASQCGSTRRRRAVRRRTGQRHVHRRAACKKPPAVRITLYFADIYTPKLRASQRPHGLRPAATMIRHKGVSPSDIQSYIQDARLGIYNFFPRTRSTNRKNRTHDIGKQPADEPQNTSLRRQQIDHGIQQCRAAQQCVQRPSQPVQLQ